MQIILPDNRWIYFNGITNDVESLLLKTFSVKHPKMQYVDVENWDGWFKKYYQGRQRMSRAFLTEVCALFDEKGFPYEIDDRREDKAVPLLPQDVTPDHLPGITQEG